MATWDEVLQLKEEGVMNGKERVLATLERRPVDRTPLDCWLYQRQFVEKLAAEYGTREQFLDEFGIDIFVGFVPYPNQMGRQVDVTELSERRSRRSGRPQVARAYRLERGFRG